MKTLLLTVIMLLVLSAPVMGEEPGIHGEVSFKYELTTGNYKYQSWVVDLHYTFVDWFAIGTTQTTFTNGFGTYFNSVPSYCPTNQLYDVYLQVNVLDNTTLKLSVWCNHAIENGLNTSEIEGQGMYLQGTYRF